MIQRPLTTKPGISRNCLKGLAWGTVLSGIMWLAIISVIVWLMGCTHTKPLPPAASIILPSITIHITEDRSTWPVSARRFEVGGCASSAGEIWLQRGAFSNEELAHRILGHEVQHLLHWKNPEVPNPDHE